MGSFATALARGRVRRDKNSVTAATVNAEPTLNSLAQSRTFTMNHQLTENGRKEYSAPCSRDHAP